MDLNLLRSLLKYPAPVQYLDQVPSTNTHLLTLAREGAPAGTAVLAGQQSAGKGLRGRSFFSPSGGLYLSLLVESQGASPGQLTTLAAVVAARSLEALSGLAIQIKWVNDLMLRGRKLGGILCEGVIRGGRLHQTVIGIGLNLGGAAFPQELAASAISLTEYKQPLTLERLAASLINGIMDALPQVPAHMVDYRARCVNLGQQVRFEYQGQERSGIALDVDDQGALLVRTDQGVLRLLAGDVSLIRD